MRPSPFHTASPSAPRAQSTAARGLFDRVTTLHRPECDALAMLGTEMEDPAPNAAQLAEALRSQAAGQYGHDVRPIYEGLRRLIGQLSGLMILARLTARRELADLPDITLCRERGRELRQRSAALSVPSAFSRHARALDMALSLSAEVLDGLTQWRDGGPAADAEFDALNQRLTKAYRLLQACSSEEAGLQMIDFAHACCSCGSH